MSTNTKGNAHKPSQFPFWKTKKFKNRKKKLKRQQNLRIVKNDFTPDDQDRAIAQGILLNDERLSFLAHIGCNELVRDLMKNPHLSSPDRLAVISHLAEASPKIFPLVEKVSLVKYAYEVSYFAKKDFSQVRDILSELQISQDRRAGTLLEGRINSFKLDRDFFDAKIYAQASEGASLIRDSKVFDTEISEVKDKFLFWKMASSFIYSGLQKPKTHGKYKHQNEITDIRLKPVIKFREWPEIEQEFGVSIVINPFEYAEVLKLRVENRGEPEVVLDLLRKVNLLKSNFEKYLEAAQLVREKAAIEAENARALALAQKEERARQKEERARQKEERARQLELAAIEREAQAAEIAINQRFYLENPKVQVFYSSSSSNDRTHRDRTIDGARENWHMICAHCKHTYPIYSSCGCRS